MSRAFPFIGLGLIALYLYEIAAVASGAKTDTTTVILYLSQLVIWVSLAVIWQARAAKLQRERDRA